MKTRKYNRTGNKVTPILSVTIGLGVSIIMSLLLSTVAAYLVSGERLPQSAIGSAAVLIQFIAALAGCITSTILSGKMPAIIASVCACGYFVILVCANILVLDSSLGGAGKGFLAILTASLVSVTATLFGKKNGKRKKVRVR